MICAVNRVQRVNSLTRSLEFAFRNTLFWANAARVACTLDEAASQPILASFLASFRGYPINIQ